MRARSSSSPPPSWWPTRSRVPCALIAVVAGTACSYTTADVTPAPPDGSADEGAPVGVFEPKPLSQPLYAVQPPSADPARQTHFVTADDGVQLYVETWLPARLGDAVPPDRVPVVVVMSPYAHQNEPLWPEELEHLVTRGYAFAQAFLRPGSRRIPSPIDAPGSSPSGGCATNALAALGADGAAFVEYLGREAPFSSGRIGAYGLSAEADAQIATAVFGDAERIAPLRAIVPAATTVSMYDWNHYDGVPTADPSSWAGNIVFDCDPATVTATADQSCDLTAYWKARDARPAASSVNAAMLQVHGLSDWYTLPIAIAGWFERVPTRKGIFGVWGHEFPHAHPGVQAVWERGDWLEVITAWYDRWLKDLPTDVESWPDAQVQSSSGEWRAEPAWPFTGGPVGQLALGPERVLGATAPAGSTEYIEVASTQVESLSTEGTAVVFETAPLEGTLHLTGQPVLDLWVQLDQPDAHIAVRLDVVDAAGALVAWGKNFGWRSAQHLEPLVENRFAQEHGVPAPTGVPLRVEVRLNPTDLVVPPGGKLRLQIAGSNDRNEVGYSTENIRSQPSGSATRVTLLHDCDHPSALRFLMPHPSRNLLNVREKSEAGALLPAEPVGELRDGTGLASETVCGRAPERMESFGP